MKKTHSLAILLTLLTGLLLGGAAIAAEHAGDAAESDSSSAQTSGSASHDSDAKGDEHAGEAAESKADMEDHESDAEHAGDNASGDDS